jgi:predicted CXXCH cytochrome family protein
MRRLLFVGLGGVLLFTMGGPGPAQADNGPHVSSAVGVGFNEIAGAGRCTSCHRAHSREGAIPLTAGLDGLCMTCHGPAAGGATTDVVDGIGFGVGGMQKGENGTAPGALRGGGFDYALIDSGAATKETYFSGPNLLARNQLIPVLASGRVTTSKHSVVGAAETAWDKSPFNSGEPAKVMLECGSCHDPHGNGNYRILRSSPASSSGASTSAAGVAIPDAVVKVYTTTNYWHSGDQHVPPVTNGLKIGDAVPDGYLGSIARWCTTCHLGSHIDVTIEMVGTTCVSCHVAHGSNASMIGPSSSPATQVADDSAVARPAGLLRVDSSRAICLMCHNR